MGGFFLVLLYKHVGEKHERAMNNKEVYTKWEKEIDRGPHRRHKKISKRRILDRR